MSALAVESLDFGYRNRSVLHDIDLTASAGRILSILGPNGAGKTTLLKCLVGLLKPSAGMVRLLGRPLLEYDGRERATVLAYVRQSEAAPFPISVFDAVLLGRRPYVGWAPRRSDLDIVGETIEQVGIGHLAQRDLRQLSGGERQQVAIAKAIAQRPAVLLLDEPTTYLDLAHQIDVLGLIGSIAHDSGVAVVMTIHDLNHALTVSDDFAVLSEGRVVASGGAEVVDAELVHRVYGVGCDVVEHAGQRLIVARLDAGSRSSAGAPVVAGAAS